MDITQSKAIAGLKRKGNQVFTKLGQTGSNLATIKTSETLAGKYNGNPQKWTFYVNLNKWEKRKLNNCLNIKNLTKFFSPCRTKKPTLNTQKRPKCTICQQNEIEEKSLNTTDKIKNKA